MNRQKFVIGNWKMHGTPTQVHGFFSELVKEKAKESITGVICPPAVFLSQASKILEASSGFSLGAQDVSQYESGAYTGQISAAMLKDVECKYVIVGHSERRQYCGETDTQIAHKFFAAKAAGLIPILCVGETQEQRSADLTNITLISQLNEILNIEASAFKNAILAYEPIWAIGTGLTATPEQAQAVHYLLRERVAEYDASVASTLPILYGGSVKPSNASTLFEMPDIDGALVGGASLQLPDFLAIYKAAE